MILMVVDTPTLVGAWYRIAVLVLVWLVTLRVWRANTAVLMMCAVGIASNVFFLRGDFQSAAYLGVPYLGLVGFIAIDRVRSRPQAIRAALAKRDREIHALRGEVAEYKVRVSVAELRLADGEEAQDG